MTDLASNQYLEWRKVGDGGRAWELSIVCPGKDRWAILNAEVPLEVRGAGETGAPIEAMVSRFLGWKLPKSVSSDQCVTDSNHPHERCGTNLLTANEARQMLEHVLGSPAKPTCGWGGAYGRCVLEPDHDGPHDIPRQVKASDEETEVCRHMYVPVSSGNSDCAACGKPKRDCSALKTRGEP